MKKLTLLFVMLLAFTVSCKKDNVQPTAVAPTTWKWNGVYCCAYYYTEVFMPANHMPYIPAKYDTLGIEFMLYKDFTGQPKIINGKSADLVSAKEANDISECK